MLSTMKTAPYWIDGPWPGRLAIVPRPRGGDWLEDEVRAWRQVGLDNVGIHCRQGIGRSAVVAACLLIFSGVDPESAFQHISAARACVVPETATQREWVIAWARALQESSLFSHSA